MPLLGPPIGQMLMFGFRGAYPQQTRQIINDIQKYHIGGVWLTDNDSPLGKTTGNIASAAQVKDLTRRLRAASESPLFIAIDAEGGKVIRLKEQYGFPATLSAQALGRINDPLFTRRQAAVIAARLKELGINFNLAPVVDLNLAPQNPALGAKERCFSSNAATVTAHARSVIDAHREYKILTCLKHFPGHGSAQNDSHLGMTDITQSWREQELEPFKTLIEEGRADAVLAAHVIQKNIDPKYPASLSRIFIRDILRARLGFDGLVLSDDLDMGAIKQNYNLKEALERAVNAGNDMLVFSNLRPYKPNFVSRVISIIRELLDEGRVARESIDRASEKIAFVKERFL